MMDFVSDTHIVDRCPTARGFASREEVPPAPPQLSICRGGASAVYLCYVARHMSVYGGYAYEPEGTPKLGVLHTQVGSRSSRRRPLRIRWNERRLLGMFFCSSRGA
jgi:hypothetical protein